MDRQALQGLLPKTRTDLGEVEAFNFAKKADHCR
jgi:hypothetical protein